jgi:hypothetical protein
MWKQWEARGRQGSPLQYCPPYVIRTMSLDEIMHALSVDGEGIRHIPDAMQTEAMAACCLQLTPRAYGFLNNRLTANPDFARRAIQGAYINYFIAPKIMKDDPEILLMAMLLAGDQCSQFVQFVCEERIEQAFDLARQRLRRLLHMRTAFAAAALHAGPLKLLRSHGLYFLRQFNSKILAFAGIDAQIRGLTALSLG